MVFPKKDCELPAPREHLLHFPSLPFKITSWYIPRFFLALSLTLSLVDIVFSVHGPSEMPLMHYSPCQNRVILVRHRKKLLSNINLVKIFHLVSFGCELHLLFISSSVHTIPTMQWDIGLTSFLCHYWTMVMEVDTPSWGADMKVLTAQRHQSTSFQHYIVTKYLFNYEQIQLNYISVTL